MIISATIHMQVVCAKTTSPEVRWSPSTRWTSPWRMVWGAIASSWWPRSSSITSLMPTSPLYDLAPCDLHHHQDLEILRHPRRCGGNHEHHHPGPRPPAQPMRSCGASALYPLWPRRMAATPWTTPSLATLSKVPPLCTARQLEEDPSLLDVLTLARGPLRKRRRGRGQGQAQVQHLQTLCLRLAPLGSLFMCAHASVA